MKFFASRPFQPGDIFGIFKALYHLLVFLYRQNYRYSFSIARDDLRFNRCSFHSHIDLVTHEKFVSASHRKSEPDWHQNHFFTFFRPATAGKLNRISEST